MSIKGFVLFVVFTLFFLFIRNLLVSVFGMAFDLMPVLVLIIILYIDNYNAVLYFLFLSLIIYQILDINWILLLIILLAIFYIGKFLIRKLSYSNIIQKMIIVFCVYLIYDLFVLKWILLFITRYDLFWIEIYNLFILFVKQLVFAFILLWLVERIYKRYLYQKKEY